jgi:KipI family sensor histidine kinase inhibitor
MPSPEFESLGDQALLLRWGEVADVKANRQVHSLARKLRAKPEPWLIDCVPAYASLAVFFDASVIGDNDPIRVVKEHLSAMLADAESQFESTESRLVEIAVCYGDEYGPDLDDVANARGLTAAQIIEKHAQQEYLVAMLGFSPGFPYLLGLDPLLAVPRLSTPRTHVSAGSVGIGGAQTGIYPNEGPGGWRLIGRTPLPMFDARRESPALLLPGDRVRFVPIDATQYRVLSERGT